MLKIVFFWLNILGLAAIINFAILRAHDWKIASFAAVAMFLFYRGLLEVALMLYTKLRPSNS